MASSYPTSFDALTNPTAGSLLTSPSHADQHINANDILEAIELHVGLRGTSFPGSPTTDVRFLRTDRDIEYFWNGTRWLSANLYHAEVGVSRFVLPLSGSNTAHDATAPWAGVYDLWLEDFQAAFFVSGGTALGASHKWVCTLVKQPAGTTIATINIDSGASDTWRNSGQIAIDALLGTTNFTFSVASTKTGTPGSLFIFPVIYYRLVG